MIRVKLFTLNFKMRCKYSKILRMIYLKLIY